MEPPDAILVMSALAQPSRLAVLRELQAASQEGLTAGTLAERVRTSRPLLSGHLAILSRAGLIRQERTGRQVISHSVPARILELISFLQGVASEA